MRAYAYLVCTLIAAAAFGCDGGQTGTPSSNPGVPPGFDAGCRRAEVDADAETPFGYPPSALLDAFAGTHEISVYWRALAGEQRDARDFYADLGVDSPVTLTIEVAPAEEQRLPPPRCENGLSVAVEVVLGTDDGLLDARASGLLVGDPSRARLEIAGGEMVEGTVHLGEREAVDLSVPSQHRTLSAPWPCGHEQRPLDDPSWGITPALIAAGVDGRVADIRIQPAGTEVRVRMGVAPARATGCSDVEGGGWAPVQLTLADVEVDAPPLSLLGRFSFYPCNMIEHGGHCSTFGLYAAGLPASETARFWQSPELDPQALRFVIIEVDGECTPEGSCSGRASLQFDYGAGAAGGASWSFDER